MTYIQVWSQFSLLVGQNFACSVLPREQGEMAPQFQISHFQASLIP